MPISPALSRGVVLLAALLSSAAISCNDPRLTAGLDGSSNEDGNGPAGENVIDDLDDLDGVEVADTAASGVLDVSLYVEEFTGRDRREPVRSGVPVSRAVNLLATNRLVIVDATGAVVPAQFRVTSRWGGTPDDATKPIKWLLVDFDAQVLASATRIYRLQTRPDAILPAPSLVTENSASRIVINTGAATFTVSKTSFTLFDRVVLANGLQLVGPTAGAGAFLQQPGGARFFASAGTTEVKVEEDGPVAVVVVARGKHKNGTAALLDWTIRMHFHKGRADSLVSYTFTDRDLAAISSYVAVDRAALSVPTNVGTSPRWSFGGGTTVHAGALGTTPAFLRQRGNLSSTMVSTFNPGNADTIYYQTGGAATGSGGKAPGWMDVSGSRGGVTTAVRWFWQQYPKKLTVEPGWVGVDLWPAEEPDMLVYSGAQKTHEVLFSFHDKAAIAEKVGADATARLASPLFARCNPSWYASTWVWNKVGTADLTGYESANQATAQRYFDNLNGVEYPATFVSRRFDGAGKGHAYSMWDFGDAREDAWSNAAYDTARTLLIHYGITGDRDFLDRGMETAIHMRDVDIEHSPLDTRAGLTTNRGVAKPWLGRTRYNPSRGPQSHDLGYKGATAFGFEHSKGQGLADHYFLTGDMMSKEVLAETYAYYDQWYVDAASGYFRSGGTRTVSHMLLIVLGYYDAFGTTEAKGRADYIVTYLNDWQRRTSTKDPSGWMWNDGGDSTSMFMNAVTAESMMLYEVMFPTGVPVRQNLVDAARWTIASGNGQIVNGAQGQYFNAWTNDNYGVTHATILDAMIVPWMGYAWGATGEAQFADIGKKALNNSIAQDSSSPLMKSFTQQTRLVPAYLWYLQTPAAKREAGS